MRRLFAFTFAFVLTGAAMSSAGTTSTSDAGTDSGLRPHCDALLAKLALPPDHGRCDDKACASAGGLCVYAGFCFGQACVKKTRDAGFTCTDGSQCEARACLARPGATPGPGSGACSPTLITLGCHVYVSRGVVSRASLCGD